MEMVGASDAQSSKAVFQTLGIDDPDAKLDVIGTQIAFP
jgi:hypothetical protein